MPTVFAGLAVANLTLAIGAAVLGYTANGSSLTERHVLLAALTLIVSCLTQTVAFTCFTVTGKLMAQYVHLGPLDPSLLVDVRRLKRADTFLVAIILGVVVFSTATGAGHWRTGQWGALHVVSAIVFVSAHMFVLYRQYSMIVRNARLTHEAAQAFGIAKATRGHEADADTATDEVVEKDG